MTTIPLLGTHGWVSGTFTGSSGPVFILWALDGAAQILLGSGCTLHVDPASALLLRMVPISDPAGHWSLPVSLPNDPAWANVQITLQAAAMAPSLPLGWVLSNAVEVVFGYGQ